MRGAAGRVRPTWGTRESCVPSRTHPLVLVHALEGVLGQRVIPVAQPGHHGTEELWGEAGQSRGIGASPPALPQGGHPRTHLLLLLLVSLLLQVHGRRDELPSRSLFWGLTHCESGVTVGREGFIPSTKASPAIPEGRGCSPSPCTHLAPCLRGAGWRGAAARPARPARLPHPGPAPTTREWAGRDRPGNTPSAGARGTQGRALSLVPLPKHSQPPLPPTLTRGTWKATGSRVLCPRRSARANSTSRTSHAVLGRKMKPWWGGGVSGVWQHR